MNKSGDLTGRVFGELTVLWEANRGNNGGSSWVCKCSCGHIDTFEGNRLLSGHNTHCRYCGFGRFRFFDHYTKVECILPKDKSFIFDYADFSLVSQYKWFICKQGYPKTAVGPRNPNGVCLHQLLMKPPKGLFVDHKDDIRFTMKDGTEIRA